MMILEAWIIAFSLILIATYWLDLHYKQSLIF